MAKSKRPAKAPTPATSPEPLDVVPAACVAIAAPVSADESLAAVFAGLPGRTGASFVVMLRPEPGRAGAALAQPLAKASGLPVLEAVEGAPLEPDHIYLAGDGQTVTADGGRLRVRPAEPTDGRVDSLLLSVIESYAEGAIVVVLDGLGADGAMGVAATKGFGGFAIAEGADDAQEPAERAVAAAGIADLRVPAHRIGQEIGAYIANLARTSDGAALTDSAQGDVAQAIARIAGILRSTTGHDFHGYKHATFLRRVHRRMQVVQVDAIEGYIERLRTDPAEVQHLFQDLLIGVTQFFRDPAEFEVIEREVIPALFEGKGAHDRLRVWVLGCATGEEAYTLAILLREHMARLDVAPHVQIFATDIDARALAIARSGRYPDSIARHVSPERLGRWFVKEGVTYSVVKELREMCIFSPHNLIRDAPFSRIDLLSCRNLLIYLNSDLQDRVIPIFHFSLRPGGFLFLGPAENVTRHQKLFAPIDRKNRIFRRLETPSRVLPDFPLSPRLERPDARRELTGRAEPGRPLSARFARRVDQIAERYAPAYLLVDEHDEVLHFSGRTGGYLEPASGAASLNLFNLVHRDLRLELRAAMHRAAASGSRAEARQVWLGAEPSARAVNLVVEPVSGADEPGAMVVIFQDAGPAAEATAAGDSGGAHDEHVQRLEAELRVTKERLQTTIEELESTNEELKSSNEEYQSINEELQSANEELETSKEELQAVNEELQTVNGELAHRVSDLGRANSDLKNLLESTQIATVFLDNELRLRSFTPASTDVFHLIETDVGRPIAHLAARVSYPELQDDARRVLKSLGQVEREVTAVEEDRRFLVRVLPYRSVDNFIAGVVVTFLEVTGTARAEAALRTSERRFGEAQQLAGVGVWEWNLESGETWWSPVVYRLWGGEPADTPPPLGERRIHPADREVYSQACERARETGELNVEWRVIAADGSIRWLAETGRIERSGGRRMLGITQDITDRKQTETRLTMLLSELQHRVRNILGVVRSVVARTMRSSSSVDELAAALDGRLDTLARTQGVFTRPGVTSVELEDLVRDELIAVATREEQFEVRGPAVRLRRDAAEALALALHELTTNAVKYGALADSNGRLSVRWRILNSAQGRKLIVQWRESGVRAVDVAPARSGFGRELIERGLPYELGAATSLEFVQGGVHATIEVPMTDRVTEGDEELREGGR